MICSVKQVRNHRVFQMRLRSSGSSPAARSIAALIGAMFLCAPAAYSVESNDINMLQPQKAQLDNTPQQSRIKLEGKAEVAAPLFTNLREWQASQYYKQGVSALSVNNLYGAAEQFRIAEAGFGMANNGRFQAQAKYAEAQTRRLLRQNAQAATLYAQAAELFRKYDPTSPYLKASIDQSGLLSMVGKPDFSKKKPLQGAATENDLLPADTLKSLPAMTDHVDKVIPLAAKVTQLAGGIKVDALKDADFFNGGNLLPTAAAVNVTDGYVKNTVLKAFTDMTCLEFAALGGNYYTAPDLYSAFKVNGKAVVVGASDQAFSPTVNITINGKQAAVAMDLPGMSRHSKNVLLVTDEQHVLAMDPRTKDTWKLCTQMSKGAPEFHWWKLTHEKKQKYISPNMKRVDIDQEVAGSNVPGSFFNHTKSQSLFSHTKPTASASR